MTDGTVINMTPRRKRTPTLDQEEDFKIEHVGERKRGTSPVHSFFLGFRLEFDEQSSGRF